jgi:hypothetical protein
MNELDANMIQEENEDNLEEVLENTLHPLVG